MTRSLHGKVVRCESVAPRQREQMFSLFSQYYENVCFESFERDFEQKDDVILLLDDQDRVRGFSTMKDLAVEIDGRTHRGLFSGDTVVARECWGQRVLGRVFLRSLLSRRARHPLSPYYWFLISKGYKTYLLMANNFSDYYPRIDHELPDTERAVLDGFARTLYPEHYDRERGVVHFPVSHGQLRGGVAAITEQLRNEVPKVAFFEQRNPLWAEGDELACIARMTWGLPLYYSAKALWRGLRRNQRSTGTQPKVGPVAEVAGR